MDDRFVLDANVLFSARLRDLFLQLRRNGVAQVIWTAWIEAEWTSALARDIRARLKAPTVDAVAYADGIERAGCPSFAAWLRQRLDQI